MVLLSLPKGGFIPKSATGLMVFIWGGGHISLGGWRTANAQSVSLVNQVAIIRVMDGLAVHLVLAAIVTPYRDLRAATSCPAICEESRSHCGGT